MHVQGCSFENQKDAIAVQSLYGDSTLLVLNGTLLYSIKAPFAKVTPNPARGSDNNDTTVLIVSWQTEGH